MIFNMSTGGASTADKIKYDNTESGLQSTDVQGAVDELNSSLTANSTPFIYDYQDGKYGFNTDPNRGADTFHPFSDGIKAYATLSAYYSGGTYPIGFFRTISSDFADDIAPTDDTWCYDNPLNIIVKKKVTTKIIIRTLTRGNNTMFKITHNGKVVSDEETLLLKENDTISLQITLSNEASLRTAVVLFM